MVNLLKTELSDEKLQWVSGQIFIGQAILVAYQLGIFNLLSNGPLSIKYIAQRLQLEERPVQAMVSCACSLQLLEYNEGSYQLSELGQKFLNKTSNAWYGDVFDLFLQQHDIMNFENIRNAIVTNKPQVDEGKDIFIDGKGLGDSRSFVRALHQKAHEPAFFWTNMFKLDKYRKFIDIGGGSGIHTIAACLTNPELQGTVCDREQVLPYTREYINEFALDKQISLKQIDLWNNPFPEGDVYFLGDIFHDWSPQKCLILAKKCFESLMDGGLIILHEMLFDSNKTGPFLTSAYNMKMMLWTEGQQFSGCEIQSILQEAGFQEIEIRKSLGNWSIIIGKK